MSYPKVDNSTRKTVLLVRGFNTDLASGRDIYLPIKRYLAHTHTIVDFNYTPNEDIGVVYSRLCDTIHSTKFDILMGHSMGGGLLAKYARLNDVSAFDRVILLMPFMCKRADYDLISKIPFARYLKLPKPLILPAGSLFDEGNALNDEYTLLSMAQTVDIYTDPNVFSDDLTFINKNPKVFVFYASQEKFNTITEDVLSSLPSGQLKRVVGLHECFRSINSNGDFFGKLGELLFT
jgi:pimeloyl-ACP methyl ester carboxylesterase